MVSELREPTGLHSVVKPLRLITGGVGNLWLILIQLRVLTPWPFPWLGVHCVPLQSDSTEHAPCQRLFWHMHQLLLLALSQLDNEDVSFAT